jgi:hypothetical protein
VAAILVRCRNPLRIVIFEGYVLMDFEAISLAFEGMGSYMSDFFLRHVLAVLDVELYHGG